MSDPRVIAVTTHGRYVVQEPSHPHLAPRTAHRTPHLAPRTPHQFLWVSTDTPKTRRFISIG